MNGNKTKTFLQYSLIGFIIPLILTIGIPALKVSHYMAETNNFLKLITNPNFIIIDFIYNTIFALLLFCLIFFALYHGDKNTIKSIVIGTIICAVSAIGLFFGYFGNLFLLNQIDVNFTLDSITISIYLFILITIIYQEKKQKKE